MDPIQLLKKNSIIKVFFVDSQNKILFSQLNQLNSGPHETVPNILKEIMFFYF